MKQERAGQLADPGPALSHSSLLYLPFFLSLRKWFQAESEFKPGGEIPD